MVAKLDLMNTEKILKAILQKVANQIQNKKIKVFEDIGEIKKESAAKKKGKKSCSSNYNGNSARKSNKNFITQQASVNSSTGFQFQKNLKKSKFTGKTCGDSMN